MTHSIALQSNGAEFDAVKKRYVFLTLPNYELIAVSSALDVLRMANRFAGEVVYEWIIATMDGIPAVASNGQAIAPTVPVGGVGSVEIMFVCGCDGVEAGVAPELIAFLQRLAYSGQTLGALCTGGSYMLAKAGLLHQYKAVVHWEYLKAVSEQFPGVNFSKRVFAVDRDRYTCSGGIAALDMMAHIIKSHLGQDIASKIFDQLILDRIRSDRDNQHVPLLSRLGQSHESLIEAAALMEANLEEPLAVRDIARLVGISCRQLERLFKQYAGEAPTKYYVDMRLRHARSLLIKTPMPIIEVAVASGFQSRAHFSKQYRNLFGYSPNADRRSTAGAILPKLKTTQQSRKTHVIPSYRLPAHAEGDFSKQDIEFGEIDIVRKTVA